MVSICQQVASAASRRALNLYVRPSAVPDPTTANAPAGTGGGGPGRGNVAVVSRTGGAAMRDVSSERTDGVIDAARVTDRVHGAEHVLGVDADVEGRDAVRGEVVGCVHVVERALLARDRRRPGGFERRLRVEPDRRGTRTGRAGAG